MARLNNVPKTHRVDLASGLIPEVRQALYQAGRAYGVELTEQALRTPVILGALRRWTRLYGNVQFQSGPSGLTVGVGLGRIFDAVPWVFGSGFLSLVLHAARAARRSRPAPAPEMSGPTATQTVYTRGPSTRAEYAAAERAAEEAAAAARLEERLARERRDAELTEEELRVIDRQREEAMNGGRSSDTRHRPATRPSTRTLMEEAAREHSGSTSMEVSVEQPRAPATTTRASAARPAPNSTTTSTQASAPKAPKGSREFAKMPKGKAAGKKQSKEARARARARADGETQTFSMPAAVGNRMLTGKPRYSNRGDRTVIRHREYFGDVTGTSAFNATTYYVNPGLVPAGTGNAKGLFNWLSEVAASYVWYRFRRLEVLFRGKSSTAEAGSVFMGCNYNPNATAPTTKADMLSLEGVVDSNAYCPLLRWRAEIKQLHQLPGGFKVRTAAESSSNDVDLSLLDGGQFYVATQGNATDNLGELYVDYEVEFWEPSTTNLRSGSVDYLYAATASNTDPLGTSRVLTSNGPQIVESVTSDGASPHGTAKVFFRQGGTFLVVVGCNGTSSPLLTLGAGSAATDTAVIAASEANNVVYVRKVTVTPANPAKDGDPNAYFSILHAAGTITASRMVIITLTGLPQSALLERAIAPTGETPEELRRTIAQLREKLSGL